MVRWSDHALAQLRHIHDYIAKDSPLYAKRVSEALVQKTLGLDALPRLGRMVPELSEDAFRELGLYSYRILYEIRPDHIRILAVIHKRQDLQVSDIPHG
ncbi:MAG: type II toxin-antitoxin system RelE/ParE family toxin [Pseudomonadales bacterium]|nr:type II toxin-antitoxin system RelE/ParE family toxin [Pseudomonadales bacterium]